MYTGDMKVVKIRRVGNSNVVSIPRELEARGYTAGTSVLVEELEGGELRIMPTEQVRDRIRGIGRRVVDKQLRDRNAKADAQLADLRWRGVCPRGQTERVGEIVDCPHDVLFVNWGKYPLLVFDLGLDDPVGEAKGVCNLNWDAGIPEHFVSKCNGGIGIAGP